MYLLSTLYHGQMSLSSPHDMVFGERGIFLLCRNMRSVQERQSYVTQQKTPSRVTSQSSSPGERYAMALHMSTSDYRSQGHTLPCVIVDIATPPSGGLNIFNLYVALSRSAGRSTIRLPRNFDEEIFQKLHLDESLMEDDRLEEENEKTRKWWGVAGHHS
ncbi:hypothetical protein EDC04DRAFT_2800920 [Pisolithus marmoratus]|nr:hypothetical protein EDC04DRAFT_2800920 [Pisolithus marmoratus]